MIRCIIVDDEFLARQRIVALLESCEVSIKVVGQCRNGKEALEMIPLKEPDLIFLDVQMPVLNGFDVLAKLKMHQIPQIIFTTAFDQYAVEAFRVNALDYLLKPIDEQQFTDALKRVEDKLSYQKMADFNQQLMGLMQAYQTTESSYVREFEIKQKGRVHTIPTDEIYYIQSNGNYVNLHTSSKVHLLRNTMSELAEQLDPDVFLRIQRSFIINRRYIKSSRYLNNNEYEFKMKDGEVLVSGRTYKDKIMNYLNDSI